MTVMANSYTMHPSADQGPRNADHGSLEVEHTHREGRPCRVITSVRNTRYIQFSLTPPSHPLLPCTFVGSKWYLTLPFKVPEQGSSSPRIPLPLRHLMSFLHIRPFLLPSSFRPLTIFLQFNFNQVLSVRIRPYRPKITKLLSVTH